MIRSGVSLQEQAAIHLPGVKGLWSLKADVFDRLLVQSFEYETRLLEMISGMADDSPEELEEVEYPGFKLDEATVACGTC